MKTLKQSYVIIKHSGGEHDFFEDIISFDKDELDVKCQQMNNIINFEWRTKHEADKRHKHPWRDMAVYSVMNLEDALDKLRDIVYDTHVPEDESI